MDSLTSLLSRTVVLALIPFVFPFQSAGQGLFTTERWLSDDATVSFLPDSSADCTRFCGIRLIYEPTLGVIDQTGSNKFKTEAFSTAFSGFGVEVNVYKAWASVQLSYLFPFRVEFDELSPVLDQIEEGNTLSVERGFNIGGSFLDGLIGIGYGVVYYDDRELKDTASGFDDADGYFYFNINPISGLRALIKD